ncbi:complement receptor type 1 isoform X4 [Anolis carolinensis]|uniref:complement receptor type 1 isoform X4 n=1 Tax=Anolis carolinensis TaxID=28377 RepID=UPI002F2B90EB
MIPAYTVSLLWVLATFLAVTLEDQGDSCNHPPRLDFAELADEYKVKNSFPVGSTVKYICRPGYVRSKPKISRRCLQNQEWSELEEFCKKKSCGHPGEPKNGWLHVSGDFLLGATVKYSCVEGYRLIGHSSRRCIVSDKKVEWTHDIPFCEPIPCFPPPDVPHGKHNGQNMDNFFVGTVVTYTCDKGYPLVGNASIYCITEDGLNGVWSGRAYCGVVQCQPPPNIQNGFHSKQEGEMFSHGMSLTYTCHPGYILLGQETIYCTASGTWFPSAPHCKAVERMLTTVSKNADSKLIDKKTKEESKRDIVPGPPRDTGHSCNRPPRLDFAELADEYKENNSFPIGSTVKYTCRPGYVRSKPKISQTCLQNQEWSELEEFCKKKSCGHPGEPEHGRLHVSGDFLFGAAIHYTCDEGYRIIGHSSRRCIISGKKVEWDHGVVFCEHIPCFPPPDVPHGKHNGQNMDNFFVGTVVTYTCDKDYPLVGNASIYCTTEDGLNGVWSGRAYCGVVQCQPPPNIQNGFHSKQEGEMFSHEMSVTYTCHPGYILFGQETIYCTASGTWSPPAPHCKGGSCGPALKLDFAVVAENFKENKSFPIGSTVKYFCRSGYYRHHGLNASLTCIQNQEWSEIQEFCIRKSCGNPGEPENGRLLVSGDFLFGSTINYTCDEGFKLIGESSRQCEVSGRKVAWTGGLPLCQSISCLPPPDILHGTHNGRNLDNFAYGIAVTYTCDKGYPLVGNASIYCTTKDGLNGVWSGRAYCGVIGCPSPQVENGKTEYGPSGTYRYNQRVTFGCNAGHRLIGSREIYCQVDGTWDPPVPRCEQVIGCKIPEIQNGRATVSQALVKPTGTITFECDSGYLLKGNRTIACKSDGMWDSPVPACVMEVQCQLPPCVKNGNHNKQEVTIFTNGMFVEYTCNPGYNLTGERTIYCTDSGTWSSPTPLCTGCLAPPQIANGRIETEILGDDFPFGSLVTYHCDPSYFLNESATIQCLSSGTWDQPAPHCKSKQEVQCQKPPHVHNGIHSKQEVAIFTSGISVEYTCEPGYIITGEATIYCTDSGMWSFPTPRCKEVQCPLPQDVENGIRNNQETAIFTRGMFVKYSCEPPYTLIGEATIYCTNSGTWNPPAPCCRFTHCPTPPEIAHGKYIGKDFTYGKTVTYICEAGYSLIGNDEVTCILEDSNSLNWTEPPKCKVVECSTPPNVHHGKYNGLETTKYTSGQFVKYTCEPGYVLKGEAIIYCTASGEWSFAVPYCEEIRCQQPPHIQNGTYSNLEAEAFSSGMSLSYTCEAGYILTGEATIYCTESGSWSPPAPRCEALQCPPPPSIPNGDRNSNGSTSFDVGEYMNYTCHQGYLLRGTDSIYCTTSGAWSQPLPRCEAMHCPLPPRVVHGEYIGKNFKYGKSVIYICDAGYSLVGDHVVTCVLEGANSVNWTEPPKCKGCLAPPEIDKGKHHNDSGILRDFPYGSSVTYYCDAGYFLIGAATVYCLSSGIWDKPVPQCKDRQSYYVPAAIGFGSLFGVLLLVISAGIWIMVSKRKKVSKYVPGKNKIYIGPDSHVQEQSSIPL